MPIALHFLDDTKPVLDRAVEFLCAGWTGDGPLDLRDRLIVVPTRQAGRRLRERLAQAAAARDTAALMGEVVTPASLFAPAEDPAQPLAAGVAAEAFWRQVLSALKPRDMSALGPASLVESSAARAATAEHLVRLRGQLCEEGYTLASFADAFGARNPEPDRWACLAQLERLWTARVRKAGWRDDVEAKLAAADRPECPAAVRRIAVLFVPDPPPLALRALDALSRRVPVEICVHAAKADAGRFDEWGRPAPDAWEKVALPVGTSQVEVCDDAVAMVELIRRHLVNLPEAARPEVTVGVGDPGTAARLAEVLGREGIPTFDPAGRPASRLPLFTLVGRLFDFRREDSFSVFMDLARHPDALRRLESVAGVRSCLLEWLDDFQNRHMPPTFTGAADLARRYADGSDDDVLERRQRGLLAVLDEAAAWRTQLDGAPLATALLGLLGRIYEGVPADDLLQESARLLRRELENFQAVEKLCPTREDAVDLLLRSLSIPERTEIRPDGAVDLLGWLELAWEDAPVLLLADLNDGVIPEAVTSDPFLPDGARREMKLRDNRRRLARDAHTLQSLVRCRPAGNIRGFLPRRSSRGDPLKPSRLLLMGSEGDLARRALYYFSEAPSPFASVARAPGWLLSPPDPMPDPPVRSLSITSLKTYLSCPFRFYLQRVLGVDEPYGEAHELDPMEFGTICHEVFDAFAGSPLADSSREGEIVAFLQAEADRIFERRFGTRLTVPLEIQRDVLRQRLLYAGRVQARHRKQGWKIVAREQDFDRPLGPFSLRGRIDRIDRHEESGRLLVIDYKTTAHAEEPVKTHLSAVRSNSKSPSYARTSDGEKAWIDLQLPLYVLQVAGMMKVDCDAVEAAYFALPNAVSDTELMVWPDLDTALVEEARACAERIAERVAAGVFWPASDEFKADDSPFALFFDSIEGHMDPAWVKTLKSRADKWARRNAAGGGRD